jgi:pyridoxal phosphate enzyme (YggS family)
VSERADRLRANLAVVDERIERALGRSGKQGRPRVLVASKYLQVDEMEILAGAGIRLVGENRAYELEEKWRRWSQEFEFHFIGHLQSRRVRQVLPYVTLIHSVDSISLVEELDKRAETEVKVLLEVNVSEEASKYGILPPAAETLLKRATAYRKVDFVGLMTMAPLASHPEAARPCFRGLAELRDHLAAEFAGRYQITELSMGMSNDYEVAVEEGASILRLGNALLATV